MLKAPISPRAGDTRAQTAFLSPCSPLAMGTRVDGKSSTKRNSSLCFPFATMQSKRAAFLLAGAHAHVPAAQKAQVFI